MRARPSLAETLVGIVSALRQLTGPDSPVPQLRNIKLRELSASLPYCAGGGTPAEELVKSGQPLVLSLEQAQRLLPRYAGQMQLLERRRFAESSREVARLELTIRFE